MAYLLDSTTIRAPYELTETNSTQVAQNRTLDGAITRDYFGDNKRVWKLQFRNCKKADYDTIKTIYNTYLSTNALRTWEITETNYTVAQTNVHLDLLERGFRVKGEDYLSDFDLTLVEA